MTSYLQPHSYMTATLFSSCLRLYGCFHAIIQSLEHQYTYHQYGSGSVGLRIWLQGEQALEISCGRQYGLQQTCTLVGFAMSISVPEALFIHDWCLIYCQIYNQQTNPDEHHATTSCDDCILRAPISLPCFSDTTLPPNLHYTHLALGTPCQTSFVDHSPAFPSNTMTSPFLNPNICECDGVSSGAGQKARQGWDFKWTRLECNEDSVVAGSSRNGGVEVDILLVSQGRFAEVDFSPGWF
jgi:hypothetical protein